MFKNFVFVCEFKEICVGCFPFQKRDLVTPYLNKQEMKINKIIQSLHVALAGIILNIQTLCKLIIRCMLSKRLPHGKISRKL